MEKLMTPFGEISILIDGVSIPYTAQRGSANHVLWPDVENRFQIAVYGVPDGREHSISCVFSPIDTYGRGPESGERLECQSFYSAYRVKMSIGVECETGYLDGKRISDEYDYDAVYLENGIKRLIFPDTKTERYVFGIAWIDDVGWNDPINHENDRDVQTWLAADPSFRL